MIVVRLMGGMGNQMFQYAAARALAHRLGAELRYDLSYIGHAGQGTIRHFELHHFHTAGRPLDWYEDLRYGSQFRAPLQRRVMARVARGVRPHGLYEEPCIAFDSSFAMLPDNTVVAGRFQSHLYFEEAGGLLRNDFRLLNQISESCRAICEQARLENSIGLHVRRTDYVDNDAYRDVIQALPLDYYMRALARVRTMLGSDARIYIVSDDITWCREQALFRSAHKFVDLSDAEHPPTEEFEVLRNCRHFVISNSTFAWWAAWLSDFPDKVVIAPEQWSHNTKFVSSDRIPDKWIKI
ncbi:alpha-1,2-fucosyltransferase [Rhodomicrobium sp. Az07]|uniref:alpha-1,2-fucosyltransferase n=1 Tax=Rhodomicrobium sp. Az07 TaxID=2839034 RepID=UPI001BEC5ECA|nr:alpha-1,2-fucosyltransferase [Rhodomicrobium sp. Az07]MBT3072161.1 alpha-1,2-fucosyltransferase [Rhodomicrobium sp. Az07]